MVLDLVLVVPAVAPTVTFLVAVAAGAVRIWLVAVVVTALVVGSG